MHFVIAGKVNCSQFSFAVMVAQRLKENLSDFTYLKIAKLPDEWEKWLIKTCKENRWYHVQSPLIWREIGLKQGKKEFIGNINKFLDMCYDYYGIPRGVLAADSFNKEEIDWFRSRTESEFFENIKLEAKKRREYRSRQVCITGAASQMAEIVIMELLKIQLQSREDGLEIRLFDDPQKKKKLLSSANDAKYCPGPSGFGNCRVAITLKEALISVDLVIVLDSFSRKPKESLVKWLKRNRNAMCALGKGLNMYAPPHCRVIIGSPSNQPICYNATVLASFATKLHVRNIVAVTQDLGREMLKSLSIKTNVPLKELYCPPVWGFVGLNKYIDLCRTLHTHVYKVPGRRQNSTLPQGTEEYELRTIGCLISEEETGDIHVKMANNKAEAYPQLGRWPCLAKATAIVDLLKLWGLKQEDGNGEILCLGVYSDGTFNIPPGIYWSQPVILKNGFWVPFPDYPVPRNYHFSCYYLFLIGLAALYRTKVKPRRYVPPSKTKTSKKKKFDFDKIAQTVGMPTIKTDEECAKYIKYLAKKEFGIDLDAVDDTLIEESETEVVEPAEKVVREELFCECWRQELKELQKVVFEHSSTTEVEMDLEENISGSEWSVINKNPSYTSFLSKMGDHAYSLDIASVSSEIPSLQTVSTSSTVCSCENLSNGSVCRCLVPPPIPSEKSSSDKLSTEHYYKDQNAQIFQDDLTDAIYADTYAEEKRVTFGEDVSKEDKISHLPRKFYGKKDAIRDETAESNMKKRILRYEKEERGESFEGERFDIGESEETLDKKANMKGAKFHVSIEGTSYNIIGDQNGLETLEFRKKEMESPSVKSFREMYTDEIVPPLQVIPSEVMNKSTTSSENYPPRMGESNITLGKSYRGNPEMEGEEGSLGISVSSFEDGLGAVYRGETFGEDRFIVGENESAEELGEVEETKEILEKKPSKPLWKREGISLCCLCRCILPEGLPCCPCGGTTVVEVFKKESLEVFIQSEDDISYIIDYQETLIPRESITTIPPMEEVERKAKEIKIKDRPPESFFPFSPKSPNVFEESARPKELTKQYIDSLKKQTVREIPQECINLLNRAKSKIKEGYVEEEMNDEKKKDETEGPFVETCKEEEPLIKTDFSDFNLFIPEGIEDWRLAVQTKYREWFFQGPNIRDESYYDFAAEEISEDEFDIDSELEMYFEK